VDHETEIKLAINKQQPEPDHAWVFAPMSEGEHKAIMEIMKVREMK
jgi:hypothetical protein